MSDVPDTTAEKSPPSEKAKSSWSKWWLFPLLPILLPYWAVKWVVGGGLKWLYDEFLCFLFLTFEYDEKGKPTMVYFLEAHPFVHFHPLAWGGFLLAATLMIVGPAAQEWVGLTLVGLLIYSGITVTIDLPFKRFIKVMVFIFIVIPLADFGLAMGAEKIDDFALGQGYPELLSWLERGVLRPIDDYLRWLDTGIHTGLVVLLSLIWTLVVGWFIVESLLDNRWGFDGQRLYRWRFGESEDSIATYYEDTKLEIPDILESLFGFAAIRIGVDDKNRKVRLLSNILFLALPGRRAKVQRIIAGKEVEPGENENENGGGDNMRAKAKMPHAEMIDAGA